MDRANSSQTPQPSTDQLIEALRQAREELQRVEGMTGDLTAILAAVKLETRVSDSVIADKVGVPRTTVTSWAARKQEQKGRWGEEYEQQLGRVAGYVQQVRPGLPEYLPSPVAETTTNGDDVVLSPADQKKIEALKVANDSRDSLDKMDSRLRSIGSRIINYLNSEQNFMASEIASRAHTTARVVNGLAGRSPASESLAECFRQLDILKAAGEHVSVQDFIYRPAKLSAGVVTAADFDASIDDVLRATSAGNGPTTSSVPPVAVDSSVTAADVDAAIDDVLRATESGNGPSTSQVPSVAVSMIGSHGAIVAPTSSVGASTSGAKRPGLPVPHPHLPELGKRNKDLGR